MAMVFVDDEIQAAESLIALSESRHRPVTVSFPRWGSTKRRSVSRDSKVERLSPSTPLSFPASGGDETPPPLPPPPAKSKILKKKAEQHKEWVKEQNQTIATLSATKASLQQYILEARSRYQRLREANSWLKEFKSRLAHTILEPRRLQSCGGRSGELDLFPVGPTRSAAVGHHQQQQQRRRLDLNRSLEAAERRAREERQRAAAYAQARKRRIELQRVKSSLKIRRLR